MKRYLQIIFYGIITSIILMNIYIAIFSLNNGGNCSFSDNQYIKYLIGSALIVLGYTFPIFIYNFNLHVLIKACIHMITGTCILIIVGVQLKWFSFSTKIGIKYFLSSLLVAILIYLYSIYSDYRTVKMINKKLSEKDKPKSK